MFFSGVLGWPPASLATATLEEMLEAFEGFELFSRLALGRSK